MTPTPGGPKDPRFDWVDGLFAPAPKPQRSQPEVYVGKVTDPVAEVRRLVKGKRTARRVPVDPRFDWLDSLFEVAHGTDPFPPKATKTPAAKQRKGPAVVRIVQRKADAKQNPAGGRAERPSPIDQLRRRVARAKRTRSIVAELEAGRGSMRGVDSACVDILTSYAVSYVKAYEGAWVAFNGKGSDYQRQAISSVRALWESLIRRRAPKGKVQEALDELPKARKLEELDRKGKKKIPTLYAKAAYLFQIKKSQRLSSRQTVEEFEDFYKNVNDVLHGLEEGQDLADRDLKILLRKCEHFIKLLPEN